MGAAPRGSGSHYAHLGVSGRAKARPHARGSRLDVHTELAIVCLRGAPLVSDLELGPEPQLCRRGIPTPGPSGVGAVPRGTGSRFARLGSAWGPPRSDLEVVHNPTPYTTSFGQYTIYKMEVTGDKHTAPSKILRKYTLIRTVTGIT